MTCPFLSSSIQYLATRLVVVPRDHNWTGSFFIVKGESQPNSFHFFYASTSSSRETDAPNRDSFNQGQGLPPGKTWIIDCLDCFKQSGMKQWRMYTSQVRSLQQTIWSMLHRFPLSFVESALSLFGIQAKIVWYNCSWSLPLLELDIHYNLL